MPVERRRGVLSETQRCGADVRRRRTVVPAERAVKVGQIAESRFEGNGADGAADLPRISQQAMRARQALAEREFRESQAHAFEQPLDMTRREFQARGYGGQCQVAVAEILADVGLDRGEPRGCQSPVL